MRDQRESYYSLQSAGRRPRVAGRYECENGACCDLAESGQLCLNCTLVLDASARGRRAGDGPDGCGQ